MIVCVLLLRSTWAYGTNQSNYVQHISSSANVLTLLDFSSTRGFRTYRPNWTVCCKPPTQRPVYRELRRNHLLSPVDVLATFNHASRLGDSGIAAERVVLP